MNSRALDQAFILSTCEGVGPAQVDAQDASTPGITLREGVHVQFKFRGHTTTGKIVSVLPEAVLVEFTQGDEEVTRTSVSRDAVAVCAGQGPDVACAAPTLAHDDAALAASNEDTTSVSCGGRHWTGCMYSQITGVLDPPTKKNSECAEHLYRRVQNDGQGFDDKDFHCVACPPTPHRLGK